MATDRPILLVEDNPDDEALTLRAFHKNRIANQVMWDRLVFIADQADSALGRTAFSPIVRENGGIEPGVMPPTSAWWVFPIRIRARSPRPFWY